MGLNVEPDRGGGWECGLWIGRSACERHSPCHGIA